VQGGSIFLRDRQSSEASRRVARGITVGHMIWLVIVAVVLNIVVTFHVVALHQASSWGGLQIAAPLLLVGAVVTLIVIIKRTAPNREH
jgi:membrane protein YdbS with pleckstrin-like domain